MRRLTRLEWFVWSGALVTAALWTVALGLATPRPPISAQEHYDRSGFAHYELRKTL